MNCFFCPELPAPPALVSVDVAEARHAAAARRQRPGDRVLLVDGKGGRAAATIRSLDRGGMQLRVDSLEKVQRPTPGIVLASAVAKGDRQRVLLDMTTQLGIEAYVPLICDRSAARPESHNVDRWTRVCVEACKQSHNPHLPDIRPIQTPAGFASTMKDAGVPVYMAYPQGDPKTPPCSVDRVAVCIGPEGGFSRKEVSELIGAGAAPWSLGPNILRIETAAVAAVNRLQSHCRFD